LPLAGVQGAALPPPSLARRAPLLQVDRVLHALRRHASLMVISLIAVTAGFVAWQLRGAAAFMAALWHAWDLFLFIVPSLVAGLLLASALRQLLSPDALARWMGADSGVFGLFVATLVGTLSPGGPMAALSILIDRRYPLRAWLELADFGHPANRDALSLIVDGDIYPLLRRGPGNNLIAGPILPRDGDGPTQRIIRVPHLHSPPPQGHRAPPCAALRSSGSA